MSDAVVDKDARAKKNESGRNVSVADKDKVVGRPDAPGPVAQPQEPDEFAVQIGDQIESFILSVREVAKGDDPDSAVPYLLLELSRAGRGRPADKGTAGPARGRYRHRADPGDRPQPGGGGDGHVSGPDGETHGAARDATGQRAPRGWRLGVRGRGHAGAGLRRKAVAGCLTP